jgi:hypothetical protein
MNEDLIQRFGFSEMYEWDELPEPNCRLGRFVTFSEKNPDKIRLVKGSNENILGISTVNSVIDSDDPAEWKYKNMCNEYGDTYLRKEKLAVGQKVYDQLNEMNYIQTRPWEHFIPIENKYYNKDAQYIPRTKRVEWIRVNLLVKLSLKITVNVKPVNTAHLIQVSLKRNKVLQYLPKRMEKIHSMLFAGFLKKLSLY